MAAAGQAISRQPDTTGADYRERLLRPLPRVSLKAVLLVLLGLGAYYWSVQGAEASPRELFNGLPNIWHFIERLFPPEFDTTPQTLQTPAVGLFGLTLPRLGLSGVHFGYPIIIDYVIETLQIAIIGTTLSIFLALPIAMLAARNVSHPVVYFVTRLLLNANRAIPEIIFALVFVAAVGLGPFGGVLALAVGSVGFMSKVYAEAIEAIDPQQILAVRATGAGRLQTLVYAVLPQAMPVIASYSLLNFEHNVRSATILGIVGAGGVGFILQKYLSLFMYTHLTGALIVIIIVVTVIDRVSDRIRKGLI
jgi:phosphonate transport system permease protein